LVNVMELLPSETKPPLPPTLVGSGSSGLLLSRDLIFTSKVKGTAAELGYPMMVAGALSQARSMIEAYWPRVVLVDLTAGELVAPAVLLAYQELTGPDVWFVAFGSHVDVDALAAARVAGCHDVLPRSRFAAELPELMRRYFSQPAPRNVRATADGTVSSTSESSRG
jgi:DNA-binding NtrC family response regulator